HSCPPPSPARSCRSSDHQPPSPCSDQNPIDTSTRSAVPGYAPAPPLRSAPPAIAHPSSPPNPPTAPQSPPPAAPPDYHPAPAPARCRDPRPPYPPATSPLPHTIQNPP